MIIQQTTSDKLIINLSLAADLEVQVSGVDLDQTSTPPGEFEDTYRRNTDVTASGDTDITTVVGASNIRRNIKYIAIRNIDASDTPVIRLKHTDGTTIVDCMPSCTLLVGESMIYNDGTWFHFDVNGGVYVGSLQATDTAAGLIEIASQAEMEAGTDVARAVTPGRAHYHPSATKFWCNVTGGGTPALQSSYNVTSIADTGTGRMTVTIATDFSSGNWSAALTTFTTTTTGDEGIPNIDSKAAGTIEAGNRIITPAFADPNIGYDVKGWGDHA